MSLVSRCAVGLTIVAAAGCSAAPQAAQCPEAPAPRASASATSSATTPKSDDGAPRLAITILPDPRTSEIAVEMVAEGDPARLIAWSIREPYGTFKLTSLRDDSGPLTAARNVGKDTITLEKAPRGALHLAYTIHVEPALPNQALPVNLDPNHFEAAGEALLALPDALDDQVVATSIHLGGATWQEPGHAGASSFGSGADREVTVRGRDLRFATYLLGNVGHALFDTRDDHDEAVWLGYTAFDPRPISADVAAFRTAIRGIFEDPDGASLTLMIVADGRTPGSFRVTRRASSVLVHVGSGEPWSSAVRIAVATEVIHGWLGSRLWIGPDDHGREAEGYWFSEGVARGLARDLLFRFGLITSTELLDEMHGLAGIVATSPLRKESNAALAARAKDAGAVPLLVARGALYAARIEGLLRKKSLGKKGLPELLRALYATAKATKGALQPSHWVAALAPDLDAAEKQVFHDVITEGARPDLPEGLLGPCFQGAKRSYAAFDLGFDEPATRATPSLTLVGLRPGGPAERAGLREGDVLIDAVISQGRADAKVILAVTRGGEKKTIAYLPAGPTAAWRGWVRKRDVAEETCTK
ncbi:MAG: hypothetical protein ABJE95_03150 [Byssovorax sp.]